MGRGVVGREEKSRKAPVGLADDAKASYSMSMSSTEQDAGLWNLIGEELEVAALPPPPAVPVIDSAAQASPFFWARYVPKGSDTVRPGKMMS